LTHYRGQAVSALNRLELREELPIMAIWGERDNIVSDDHAHAAHEARTDARLELLPDVGHFAHVEAPNEVVELIEDFIARTERRDVGVPRPNP
jgi:pimeloyl-ACP methyl ester carboxylesterase